MTKAHAVWAGKGGNVGREVIRTCAPSRITGPGAKYIGRTVEGHQAVSNRCCTYVRLNVLYRS